MVNRLFKPILSFLIEALVFVASFVIAGIITAWVIMFLFGD